MSWRRDPVEKPHCYGNFNNETRECGICFLSEDCNDNISWNEEYPYES